MDGIINVNKPSGPTSFAIVAQLRRIIGERRVGHGGTLDPLASGVLPLFLGRATRLVEYLHEYHKSYLAGVILGVATDTYDAQGRVLSAVDASKITLPEIAAALTSLRGTIAQTPPAFSAIKRDGRPLYELARQGLALQADSRKVNIYRLEVAGFQSPLLTLDIECGKGTYIRSLADDLGRLLGVGAHLVSLTRTSYGPFNINNAVSLEQLTETAKGGVAAFVQPMDTVLASWPAVTLTEEQGHDARCGRQLVLEAGGAKRLRAYGVNGHLLALLSLDKDADTWQPDKVFEVEAKVSNLKK